MLLLDTWQNMLVSAGGRLYLLQSGQGRKGKRALRAGSVLKDRCSMTWFQRPRIPNFPGPHSETFSKKWQKRKIKIKDGGGGHKNPKRHLNLLCSSERRDIISHWNVVVIPQQDHHWPWVCWSQGKKEKGWIIPQSVLLQKPAGLLVHSCDPCMRR